LKQSSKKAQKNTGTTSSTLKTSTVSVFLRYLFSGEVDKLVEMYWDLFAAAGKYDVQPLREIYKKHMAKNITVGHAADVLALAERHSVEPRRQSMNNR
jgi:hypothetical protein